ncbi:MAG TPA: CCA tRNA nucleotidyltransferase [Candidatus Ornithospirochaeta avicola]|uniref:CCA tRNA nucleotidyltransferase n=1 Tax=Candidatus Ornithospirochaeta avicola TaxID=2840896 RepID=A0A9D1TPI4_9SPIO|nr:CCA tRNA nucleotidyltransferase [Candidatus Ornithospirochaeta avicola]
MKYRVPEKIKEFAKYFNENGYKVYLVGGAVRDFLLKKENQDYDFTTDARPEDVKRIFRRTIDTGIKHGTVTVLFKGESYEVTTFRSDGVYLDSRHPETIEFTEDLEEDLKRRDFTINALAASLPDGEIIDLHEGKKDLKKGIIRAIGNAEERFSEDALRMLRALRFSSKLSFRIEDETFSAIVKMKDNIRKVSAERIKEELFSLILSDNPTLGLEQMRKCGLMEIILPEINAAYGFALGGMHKNDLYTHLLRTLDYARINGHSSYVRLAALFHDIGKLSTRKNDESGEREYTFYGHEIKSAEIFESIARRLKTSNEEREKVSHLIRMHMFNYSPSFSDAAVRRFVRAAGRDNIEEIIDLRLDDALAISGNVNTEYLVSLIDRIKEEDEKNNAISLKDLKINGKDLIENKIAEPSAKMGRLLEMLLDEVIENPKKNDRAYLLSRASVLADDL